MRRFLPAAIWVSVFLNISCTTALVRSPEPMPQSRLGLIDRWGKSEIMDPPPQAQREMNRFRWPLRTVRLTSGFGKRGAGDRQSYHRGVDLRAAPGTAVYSVQSGRVAYAGRGVRGYGNLVVIRHEAGLSTVYAHNSKILVRVGQKVVQGQRIARTGSTGRSRGPHLHFEIRSGLGAVDPIRYIPGSYTIAFNAEMR
jgi:murein DD-endopeptidase MepM/ murein hydrolase activator NlpD